MTQDTNAQEAFAALDTEYRAYIEKLRAAWLAKNRVHSNDVYEVMRPEQRAEVQQRIAAWAHYITPLAEAWWKERGYGVIWPASDAEPMKLYLLEAA